MELASIVEQYYESFIQLYGDTLLVEQHRALNAIRRCRTADSGNFYAVCSKCDHGEWRPLSCGNRNCPKCQNHLTSQWIDKQLEKLMPVPYFMATFTLPYELRPLAYSHQKILYSLMFECVAEVLKSFGLKKKHLGAEIGMTLMLHTHSRRLEYHPHIHAIVPGGGIDRRFGLWRRTKTDYLFNGFALAKAFQMSLLEKLKKVGLKIPFSLPEKWVAHCDHVGAGESALKYLARYLYRGVISEKSIVANNDGEVTFRYTESKSGETKYRSLKGEKFLKLILKHVLPNGFRRVRDYGFLHGNAKKIRSLIQLILHVIVSKILPRPRPTLICPKCQTEMIIKKVRWYFEPG